MENSTLYASDLSYEFEKARIDGANDYNIVQKAYDQSKKSIPDGLEYLDDIYDEETGTSATAFKDKTTGEVIISYTGTNISSDAWNDAVKSDFKEIFLGLGEGHYQPAFKFYEEIREKYGDNIILTGHSLGGNIAQRVALEYNVQKTIVYNPAPLLVGANPAYVKKISKMMSEFTGKVIRFQSESDVLNNSADAVGGVYIGVEYVLPNAGYHFLSDIMNSKVATDEIARVTKQLNYGEVLIDINNDGVVDVDLGKLDFSVKNLFSGNNGLVEVDGEKIQLTPDILRILSNNLKINVLSDITYLKSINNLCIEKNNKTRFDFEKRKNKAADEIKNEFNNAQVPQVLDNLKDSVGEIIRNKSILEGLNKSYSLKMEEFTADETPYVNGNELNETLYNLQLTNFYLTVEPLLNQCNKEKTYDITSIFNGRPTILKSWQAIEAHTEKLLKESEKTLEGDGLRTGKEDGISQALTTVLDTAKNNIEELEKTISNTAELCQGLADNFSNQDSWIGQNIQSGKFVGSAPERAMPASYKEYLERDGIFDDVKDVLQAFDNQVEKRSEEFAKKVSEVYRDSFGDFEGGLENWNRFADDFERCMLDVTANFSSDVYVEKKYEENGKSKTKKNYWGKMSLLYPKNLRDGTADAETGIIAPKRRIEQTIATSKRTKSNLSNLEPQIKKIVEGAVYKGLDLDEIVNSQKVIIEISEKIMQELVYVMNHISSEGMSGKAISALNNKLKENKNSVDYYRNFVNDCFGNQS